MIGAPIIGEAGLILAVSATPGAFTDDHVATLELIAAVAEAARERGDSGDHPRNGDLLEEVASILAHDFKSPLTVALGNLDLVRDETDLDRVATIATALERLESMIDDLVTLASTGERVDPMDSVSL